MASLPVSTAQAKALAQTARAKISPAAVSRKRKRMGLAIAVLADLLQMGMFEVFMPGALSPPDDVLDVIVGVLLMIVIGFRWRFLFALVLELTPGAALFPSWTGFVLSLPTLPDEAPAQNQLVSGSSAKISTSTPAA
jgi:hypothetical protein